MENSTTFRQRLNRATARNESLVCVGLDPDPERLPAAVRGELDPVLAFNQALIEATADLACAYKPNFAFYGALGESGWATLAATIESTPEHVPVIVDAKVGDIGSTAEMYARMLFDQLGADAVTVNPLMGEDAVAPFLHRREKGVFLLCLTSNDGAEDIEKQQLQSGVPLYEHVAAKAVEWNANGNVGLVVGATQPDSLRAIRRIAPDLPILMPGVGAQGGEVEVAIGLGQDAAGAGLVVNASRSICYAGSGPDFAAAARRATLELRDQINQHRRRPTPG